LEPTKAAEEAQQNTNSNPNTQTSDKGLRGSWSLLSLIISAIAVALVFALLAAILIRREQGKDNEDIQNANKQKAEDASRETSRAISLALLQPADKKPNKKPAQPPIASSEQLIGFDPEGDDDARDRARKSSKTIKTAALALGILTPITFLLLDDLTHPMMWINPWTPIVATVFILHLIALIAYICHHRNQPGRPLVQQSPKCHPEHINTDRALL
jgi:uncharacterized membrane protein